MDDILDVERGKRVKNTVISSLLTTAGGIAEIKKVLQQTRFESQLVNLQSAAGELNDADILSRMLGVEPLISEQEHAKNA